MMKYLTAGMTLECDDRSARAVLSACLAVAALCGGGCANFRKAASQLEDVAPRREVRQQQLVEDFERRRDDSQYRAALAAWERGDVRDCEKQLVELLQRDPANRDARLTLADLYVEQNNPAAAERHYRALIEHAPQDARAQRCFGMFLEISDRQDEAGRHFARAAELEPEDPLLAADAAPPASELKPAGSAPSESDQAAAAASQSVELSAGGGPGDADTDLAAAAQLLRSGQAAAALRRARDAAARHPDHAGLQRLQGAAQLQLGDLKSAQASLRHALSLDSRNALTYFLLGCTLAQQGDSTAAERNFQTAHDLDPRYPAHP